MKKLIASLLCLVMVVSMVACGGEKNPPPTDEKVITIGVFEPTSGQNGAGGKKEILGIQYANSLYPTVTIGGEEYKIELTYADNQSDSSKAPTAAQQLVSKGVTAVLGTYGSSCAIAGGPYFEQAKIPAIGTSCTNPQVTQGNDYYFRVCFIDPFQSVADAQFAKKQGVTKAAVITEAGDDYSAGLGTYFVKAFEALGGEVVEVNFQTGETDFSGTMASLASQGIEAIFASTRDKPVRVQMMIVSIKVPVIEIKPCSAAHLVLAAAATIGAEPKPDSLENTPRATPLRIASITVAPRKPP